MARLLRCPLICRGFGNVNGFPVSPHPKNGHRPKTRRSCGMVCAWMWLCFWAALRGRGRCLPQRSDGLRAPPRSMPRPEGVCW